MAFLSVLASMSDPVELAFAVVTSVVLSAGSSFFTFRLGVERRLAQIEANLKRDAPASLSERIRDAEEELKALRPIRLLLLEHGEGATRFLFQRGAEK